MAQVVLDLDLTESAVREWIKQAEVDAGQGPTGVRTTDRRHTGLDDFYNHARRHSALPYASRVEFELRATRAAA